MSPAILAFNVRWKKICPFKISLHQSPDHFCFFNNVASEEHVTNKDRMSLKHKTKFLLDFNLLYFNF